MLLHRLPFEPELGWAPAMPVPAAHVGDCRPAADEHAAKRVLDAAVAACLLAALLPLMLVIAAAVAMSSPGGVFFRQPRLGLNGRPFQIWKFRTMHAHAADLSGRQQTRRNDPRVTRIGRLLRRTSLDELPQLINVLTGDMSLVGPRPHTPFMLIGGVPPEQIAARYNARLAVHPGITGWAQINGSRGAIDTPRALRRRLALDLHYIEAWSLRLDIEILLRTAWLPFADRSAF